MTVKAISSLEDLGPYDLNNDFALVEESPIYPGQLVFVSGDQSKFYQTFTDFISRFQILKDLSLWEAFVKEARAQGYDIFLMPSGAEVIGLDTENRRHLRIDGFCLPNDGKLFGYQHYGLQKALSLVNQTGFMFFNWGTGSGKSIAAAAGAQELIINRKEFDIALVFTLRKIKGGLARTFSTTTQLRTRIIDGSPERREREYAKADADVYVMNYEKAHYDQKWLLSLIKKKRVLFIFDEVQRILTWSGGKMTLAAKGINALVRKPKKRAVWPMSASIINHDPVRYWRVFQWAPGEPLDKLGPFRKQYQISGTALWAGEGARVVGGKKDVWNEKKLEEVRHRIAFLTHAVRKTDPGVREMFKGIQFIPVPVEMNDTDRIVYDFIRDHAIAAKDEQDYDRAGQLVHLMKLVCNTSEALMHSTSEFAKWMTEGFDDNLLKTSASAKFEMVLDKIIEIRDQGDKVVLFTKHTNLGLFLISKELEKHKVNHVLHWGTGMTDKQGLKAQDKFNNDPDVTVFATSDAGTYGLNLQSSRYVINYDIPMSYDDLMQRNSRIDRADSHLDGLTCYGYYCADTVEERSFSVMEQRRKLSETIQGTKEALSREGFRIAYFDDMNQHQQMEYLLRRSL